MRGINSRARLLLILASAVGVVVLPAVASSETTPTVEAVNNTNGTHVWKPPTTTVNEGGSVNVANPTSIPHGVEWQSGPETPKCTSGVIVGKGPGASGTHWSGSCAFIKPGTYVFFCTVHGSEMTETVTVNKVGGSPPTVTKVSPTKGPAAGGTSVTVTGTNFTGATAVKFGSLAASSFKVLSATSVTAVSPAETAATVDVAVTTPGGTSATSLKDHFTFGPPTVTGLSPNAGSKAGGTIVTVTGTGFATGTGATIFKFGSTPGSSVNCASTTSCAVTSPAHAAGKVDVKATVGKLTSPKNTPADQFTYS